MLAPGDTNVRALHTCVPGRVRVHVKGLRQSESTQLALRCGLARQRGIKSVAVSAVTGNVTIVYAKELSPGGILERVRCALKAPPAPVRSEKEATWETLEIEEVASRLDTSLEDGLSYKKAARRLRDLGRNELIAEPPRSKLSILREQFSGAPVAILLSAGLYSLCIGALIEAAAVGAVLAVNAAIGTVTESKAEATVARLARTGAPLARVLRDGKRFPLDGSMLVPGDVVYLERGDLIPADARLAEAEALSVSEAALTGESLPIHKHVKPLKGLATPLAGRANMVYRGTIAVGGSGKAIVVATGQQTEIGRVQALVSASRPPATPTQLQLVRLGQRLALITSAASLLLILLGSMRGLVFFQLLRSAFSLAVASIPEGLPLIATTTHALGVEAMRKQGILVRRPDALETLASVDVICLDKTGTLTENRMSLTQAACRDEGADLENNVLGWQSPSVGKLLRIAALCNEVEIDGQLDASLLGGSATELALISAAARHGIDVRRLHRENKRKWVRQWTEPSRFMISMHETAEGPMLAMKGEPLEVLRRCVNEYTPSGAASPLTPARRSQIEEHNSKMAAGGLRVLGFSFAAKPAAKNEDGAHSADMTWLGLAGLADPIRDSAGQGIKLLQKAGIRPIILTGDQFLTAQAVAKGIGLERSAAIVDAGRLENLSLVDLAALARRANVFARITPAQKLRVVEALQRTGSVVAMVGDGINDSPALRKADVGIAMSIRADAAARDVADIVVPAADLCSIATAVAHGRGTYENVRKALRFLLGTNTSEVLLMLGETAAGFGEALSPIQLLWINLITDVAPGIGLAMQGLDPKVMQRPPEARNTPLLGRRESLTLMEDGVLLAGAGMAAGLYGAARFGLSSPRTRTLTFGSLIAAQLHYASACRRKHPSDPGPPPANKSLRLILAASVAAQMAMMMFPALRRLLGLAALTPLDAAVMIAAGLLPAAARRLRLMGASKMRPDNANFRPGLLDLGSLFEDETPRPSDALRFRREQAPQHSL